jgi:hypothetical protein
VEDTSQKLLQIQEKYDNLTRLLKEMIDPLHPIYSHSVNYMILTLFFVQLGVLLEGFLTESIELAALLFPKEYFGEPLNFWLAFLESQTKFGSEDVSKFFVNKLNQDKKTFEKKRLKLLFDLDDIALDEVYEGIKKILKDKRNKYAHATKTDEEGINWIRLETADSLLEQTKEHQNFRNEQKELTELLLIFDNLRRIILATLRDKVQKNIS